MKSRSVIKASLLLLCSVFSLCLAGTSQAAEPTMEIGTVPWVGYSPFYVASAKHFFSKYGVHVELKNFSDPTQMPGAIMSGSLAGAMYTYDLIISADSHGLPLKVVMPIDYSNGADALVGDDSITSLAQLKGKKIAYPYATCDDLLVVYALKSVGLKESDIVSIDTTPEDVAAAMQSGGVVAGATYEPSISQILALNGGKKFHLLYTSKAAPGLITDVLFFPDAYIKSHPKNVTAVIKGYLDGLAYMHSHPEESFKYIGKYMGVSASSAKQMYNGAYNIPEKEMPSYFKPHPGSQSLFTVGHLLSKMLQARGQIDNAPKISDTIDSQFVKHLAKASKD